MDNAASSELEPYILHDHSSLSLATGVTSAALTRRRRLPILIHLHRFGHQLVELTDTRRVRWVR